MWGLRLTCACPAPPYMLRTRAVPCQFWERHVISHLFDWSFGWISKTAFFPKFSLGSAP